MAPERRLTFTVAGGEKRELCHLPGDGRGQEGRRRRERRMGGGSPQQTSFSRGRSSMSSSSQFSFSSSSSLLLVSSSSPPPQDLQCATYRQVPPPPGAAPPLNPQLPDLTQAAQLGGLSVPHVKFGRFAFSHHLLPFSLSSASLRLPCH